MDMKASGYIMKPVTKEDGERELSDLRFPLVPQKGALLRVQCFGNFDVFTPNGDHVRFERSKAKEVFAYLVHRHGASCTTKELFAIIFEDEPYDKKLQNLLQTYIYSMIKSLKDIGAVSVIVRSYNALAVNTDLLDCDYYRFKQLDAGAVNAYEMEYMNQYEWADFLYNGYWCTEQLLPTQCCLKPARIRSRSGHATNDLWYDDKKTALPIGCAVSFLSF